MDLSRRDLLCGLGGALLGTARTVRAQSREWPMFAHDVGNTGYAPDAAVPGPVRRRWRYRVGNEEAASTARRDRPRAALGSSVASPAPAATDQQARPVATPPAVVGGSVYVASSDGAVIALNAADGSVEWRSEAPGRIHGSAPAVAGGRVYVGTAEGVVAAFDARTGDRRWEFTTGDALRGAPPTVHDGTVLVGSTDEHLYALDAASGEQRWRFGTSGSPQAAPAAVDGRVFVADGAHVYALDAATGDRRWRRPFETAVSAPVATDSVVYVVDVEGTLHAMDAAGAEDRWTFETETNASAASLPAVAEGAVYYATTTGTVFAVDSGERRWQFDVTERTQIAPRNADSGREFETLADTQASVAIAGPVVAGDGVLLGVGRGIYAFDAAEGDLRWQFQLPADSTTGRIELAGGSSRRAQEAFEVGAPVVADGVVYVVDSEGYVYALDARPGGGFPLVPAALGTSALAALAGGVAWYRRRGDSRPPEDAQSVDGAESERGSDVTSDRGSEVDPRRGSDVASEKGPETTETGSGGESTDSGDPVDGGGPTRDSDRSPEFAPPSVPSGPELSGLSYEDFQKGPVIGQGASADVYRATVDGEEIAVKEPRIQGTMHRDDLQEFLSEAETWSKLDDHEGIVDVVGWGEAPVPWIAMEYIDGGDLSERAGQLAFQRAVWTALAITSGVRHAHTRGVVHLDLKPENVLFRTVEDGPAVPKVGDWGLAKTLLDHTNSVEGFSPQYAAPEQLQEGRTDQVTDVYGLGAVLYELFTGRPPFEGTTAEVVTQVLEDQPPLPSEVDPSLPAEIDEVLATAMAKDRRDRYEDVLYLRDDLRDLVDW